MAILPDNEFYTFEDRNYINPQVSLDEQNAFIGNLRNTQQVNNAEINTQTYNLGTAVPPSVGGLIGADSYFSSRYQTPQMNSLAASLRATAQAKALNDMLANEQAKMQKRYNDAYHASQIRGSKKDNGGGGEEDPEGEDEYKSNTSIIEGEVPGINGGSTVATFNTDTGEITGYVGVPYGEEGKTSYTYNMNSNYTSASVPTVRYIDNTGKVSLAYKLPSGKLVPHTKFEEHLVQDKNGKFYLIDNRTNKYEYVGE